MQFKNFFAFCAIVVLTACISSEAEVRILPASYSTGTTVSELATPVVDEVVRLKPASVLILTCTTTPPERLAQFDRELNARITTKVRLSFLSEVCP